MKVKRLGLVVLLAVLMAFAVLPAILSAHSTPAVATAVLVTDTAVLYDGALGTLPGDQGFEFVAFPGGPTQVVDNGGTILDTTAANAFYAGYFGRQELVPRLDRTAGYTITLAVQLLAETHANNDRAGFSLIVLSDDGEAGTHLGIELAFWEDEIWAQDDDNQGGALFTHAEGISLDTHTPRRYHLAILNDTYTLSSDGAPLLTGRLRDYSNFAGFPDPYETPNFLFLGDDTSSAAARIKLDYVAIVTSSNEVIYDEFLYLPLVGQP